LLPVEAARGYRQNEFLPFWTVGPGLNPVQPEKYDAGAERRPLIAIDEGAISTQIIQIRCRDFGQISIWRFASKTCLRGCNSRLEQGTISDTV